MVGHENEIYSKTTQRITEDTDWADGLISRWVWHIQKPQFIYCFPKSFFLYTVLPKIRINVCSNYIAYTQSNEIYTTLRCN